MKISSALTTILIQAGFISSLPSSTSRSAVAPPDTSVTVQWAGSGCSGSSGASYVVDPTLTVFNLTTPNLISTSSGSSGPPITRKNCGFILGFSYPAGWQYAVQNEAWSGTANVEAGLTGRTAGHYYFSGDVNQVDFDYPIAGPYNARFNAEYTTVGKETWSPCQGSSALIVNVETRLQRSSGNGSVSLDKVGVALTWRQC